MANYVVNTARAPGAVARGVTQRSGSYSGRGMLAAELLVGFVIIAIRLVADFEVQEDGAVKGKVLHPQGQYGPMAIMAALLGSFFFLSFVAMGGGTRAKLAVIMGGAIILTLGVRSYPEVVKIGNTIGSIGTISVPPPSGTLPNILGDPGSGGIGSTGVSGSLGAAAAPGSAASQALFGNATANAYGATTRALENLNLAKVVGDSVVFVGDAGASIFHKIFG